MGWCCHLILALDVLMLIQSNLVIIDISASILICLSIYLCFGFIFFVQMLFSVESDKSSEAARRVTTAQLHNVTTRLFCTATLHVCPPAGPVQCFAGHALWCRCEWTGDIRAIRTIVNLHHQFSRLQQRGWWIDPLQSRPGRGLLAAHHLRRGRRSTTAHSQICITVVVAYVGRGTSTTIGNHRTGHRSQADWWVWSGDSCALITWNAVYINSIRFNLIASFPLKLLWFFSGLVWEPQNRRGLKGLKFSSYSKLNKEGILAPLILSGFQTSKLALFWKFKTRRYWREF